MAVLSTVGGQQGSGKGLKERRELWFGSLILRRCFISQIMFYSDRTIPV